MNVRDAAIQVLREAGEPLHAKEIAERMLADNLWEKVLEKCGVSSNMVR